MGKHDATLQNKQKQTQTHAKNKHKNKRNKTNNRRQLRNTIQPTRQKKQLQKKRDNNMNINIRQHYFGKIYRILTQFQGHIFFQVVWSLRLALGVKHQQNGSEIREIRRQRSKIIENKKTKGRDEKLKKCSFMVLGKWVIIFVPSYFG